MGGTSRSGTERGPLEGLPAVVEAAADALGARSAPLVCVEGVPSTAAMVLLHGLSAAGACVRVHADLDWAGLRIAGLEEVADRADAPGGCRTIHAPRGSRASRPHGG